MTGNSNPVGNPVILSSGEEVAGGEYVRFEDATRKLVKVPKSEVDKKRSES